MAHVHGLRCRECGREYDVAPIFTCEWCFGPLEVAYDYDAIARVGQPREDRGRPARLWRYADLLPVDRDPAVDLGTGFTPLVRADRLAAELGLGEVWIKNDTAQPDELVQGPRRLGRAVARRSSSGSRSRRARRPATSPTRSPRTPRTPGCAATCSSPPNLEQGKVVTTAVYGGNVVAIDGNYDDVNRLCAELAGIYEWAFVNVNMRPYYAEGSKTLAFETAEQLGWQAPDHVVVPDRERVAAHQDPQGLRRAAQGRPARRGAARARVGRAGARLLAGRDGVARGVRHDPAGEARHDRQVARDRQPGRRLLRARRGAHRPAAGSRRSPTTRSSTGMQLLARTEGIFAETAGGVTIATLKQLAAEGVDPARRAGRRLHHRPRAEDARRGRAHGRPDRDDRARRSTRSTTRSTSRRL